MITANFSTTCMARQWEMSRQPRLNQVWCSNQFLRSMRTSQRKSRCKEWMLRISRCHSSISLASISMVTRPQTWRAHTQIRNATTPWWANWPCIIIAARSRTIIRWLSILMVFKRSSISRLRTMEATVTLTRQRLSDIIRATTRSIHRPARWSRSLFPNLLSSWDQTRMYKTTVTFIRHWQRATLGATAAASLSQGTQRSWTSSLRRVTRSRRSGSSAGATKRKSWRGSNRCWLELKLLSEAREDMNPRSLHLPPLTAQSVMVVFRRLISSMSRTLTNRMRSIVGEICDEQTNGRSFSTLLYHTMLRMKYQLRSILTTRHISTAIAHFHQSTPILSLSPNRLLSCQTLQPRRTR